MLRFLRRCSGFRGVARRGYGVEPVRDKLQFAHRNAEQNGLIYLSYMHSAMVTVNAPLLSPKACF